MTCALTTDPVDELLARAQPALLFLAPAAIRRGPGSALIVTVDCDGDPVVDLWSTERIARMIGADYGLVSDLRWFYSLTRAPRRIVVVVCAPGATPTAVEMDLGPPVGWYSIAYVKIERYWHYVWALWPERRPTAELWIPASATGTVQQSFQDRTETYAYQEADVEADEELRELIGYKAATYRLDPSFARAAWRESLGGRPNYRAPREGVTQYAPMPGHDRPPTRWAGDYHLELARLGAEPREEIGRALARLNGVRDSRSPLDRLIDEACQR